MRGPNFMRTNSFVSLFLVSALVSLVGCSDSSGGGDKAAIPKLDEGSVSANGCLNLQAVHNLLGSGASGAIKVTSDFKADSKLSGKKALFHTNAAFDLRDTDVTSIFPLLNPTQTGCETVQAQTLSGDTLDFKVISSSSHSLKIAVQKATGENLKDYQKDALNDRMHVKEYEFTVINPMHLRVVSTYKGFDAHCKGKKPVTNTIQEDFYWGMGLPGEVLVSDSFYNQYLSTVNLDGTIPDPIATTPAPAPETPAPGTQVPPVDSGAPIDAANPGTPVDPTAPPGDPSVPVDPAVPTPEAPVVTDPSNPEAPGTPAPADPANPGGIFPAMFRTAQASDIPAGYVKISVDEIRNLLRKPIKAEYVRCAF